MDELGERLPKEKGLLSSKGQDASNECLDVELMLCMWAQRRHWELRPGEEKESAIISKFVFSYACCKEGGLY